MVTDKNNTLNRLNRIEGQVRGIRKMIEDDRYCIDILQQMQAIKSALSRVEDAILKSHSQICVADSAVNISAAPAFSPRFSSWFGASIIYSGGHEFNFVSQLL
jgi:DNA-binding FrmR family transcriptional regulator